MPIRPRDFLKDAKPYVLPETTLPGDERVIQIASNESPYPPSPKVREALSRSSDESFTLYPPSGGHSLGPALSAHFGIREEKIVFGNGSGELINMICRAMLDDSCEGIMSANGYPYFKVAISNAGAEVISIPEQDLRCDLQAMLAAVNDRTRLIFLANPNNPTGAYLTMTEIREFHRQLPGHVLLVLDEAYADFLPDDILENDSGFALCEESDNVCVLRTFSKVFGLAGVRVGWCYGPDLLCRLLHQLREGSNLSGPGEIMALAALEDKDYTAWVKSETIRLRQWLSDNLTQLGLKPHPSHGNFILVDIPDGRAADLQQHLRSRRILGRPMAPHGLPDSIRFSIGAEEDLKALVAAVADFMGEKSSS